MHTKIERRKRSVTEQLNQFLMLGSDRERDKWLQNRKFKQTSLDKLFIFACESGQLTLIHYLINNNKVSPAEYDHGFCVAAENGCLSVVKYFIEQAKADPTAFENFAIGMAAANGHLDILQYLVKNTEVDPAANDNFAINSTLENGCYNIALYLASIPSVQNTMDSSIKNEIERIKSSVREEYKFRLISFKENYVTFFQPSTVSMLDKDVKEVIGLIGNSLVFEELNLPNEVLDSIFNP